MNRIFIVLALIGYSTTSLAQNYCNLEIRERGDMARLRPFIEDDIFQTTISYENAPLDNVGYFHNESQGSFCSGFLHGDYVLTISTCVKEIQNNNIKDYFTIIYDNKKYTTSVDTSALYEPMGIVTLNEQLPYKANSLTSRTYENYLGKKGWLIRGFGTNDGESTMFTQDGCSLTSGSGKVYQHTCPEKANYKMGAVIMGNLCDEWQVAGFMDGVGKFFMIDSAKIEYLANQVGKSCKFNPTKPCEQVKMVYPVVRTNSPELNMEIDRSMKMELNQFRERN